MQSPLSVSNNAIDTSTSTDFSLDFSVRRSISMHTEFRFAKIHTQNNIEKYYDSDSPGQENEYLNEIFESMKGLNVEGLQNSSLGKVQSDGTSFRSALDKACQMLSEHVGSGPISYVELGPEPIKTRHIIKELQLRGVVIERYIAVDINPASAKYMRSALSDLLPESSMTFVTSSFEDFSLERDVPDAPRPALVTMLGFQEGNDDPSVMTEWLASIARPGDCLISEVQLYNYNTAAHIAQFYAHRLMQRFSRLAFEQAHGPTLSSNRFFLLPVETKNKEIIYTAILGEEFIDSERQRKLFVSNYCLKFDKHQYANYRQSGSKFRILNAFGTEDQTLQFQISQRC